MTKEERAEYDRKYQLANKERIAKKRKEYRERNKQSIAATCKSYYDSNKEQISKSKKEQVEGLKDGLFTVYYLPEEHYVGMTNFLTRRLRQHKHVGRHVQDAEAVCSFETKSEALAFEAKLHSFGYNGINETRFTTTTKTQ